MSTLLKTIYCLFIFSFIVGNGLSNHIQGQIPDQKINQVDEAGMKQGPWQIKSNEVLIEEGNYVNNKKQGIWKAYYENQQLKHEITFINGEAKGSAKFYYKDGTLRESGNWQVDHWEGSYQYYYETGALSYDWFYNSNGKRQGEQRYYHANGQIMYEGQWQNGQTDGALKVYDEDGLLIQEKIYNKGEIARIEKPTVYKQANTNAKFTGTGFHTIVNLNGQIDKKGFFMKGKLINGEKHLYDSDGNSIAIIHYKNGVAISEQTEE